MRRGRAGLLSYVIFYIFFGTIEGQNLVYLLLLGGLLHQFVNRPRGVPVHWDQTPRRRRDARHLLFSRTVRRTKADAWSSPLGLLLGWFIEPARGAEVDWWPLIILGCLFLVPCV